MAIPWSWLTINPHAAAELNAHISLISNVAAADLGIQDGTYWAIWDARRLKAFGVCTNNDTLRSDILRSGGEGHLNLLHQKGEVRRKSISDVNPDNYKHQFVVATFTPQNNRVSFVDN